MSGANAAALASTFASVGGGGGSPAFVDAIAATRADSVATLSSGTGGNGLNPTGTNRIVIGAIHTNEFGTQATHDDMDLGAQSLDQLGSTNDFAGGFNSVSMWVGIAPSTGEQAMSGDVSASQAAMLIAGVAYSGADQTTPVTRGTPVISNFSTASGDCTATITASVGQKVGAIIAARDSGSTGPLVATEYDGADIIYDSGGVTFQTSALVIVEKDAVGGTNTIGVTLAPPSADSVDYIVIPYVIDAP